MLFHEHSLQYIHSREYITMKTNRSLPIQIDEQGHLILPPEILRKYGLMPGGTARLSLSDHGLHIARPISSLARVYIEPTNVCNFDCRTCMRNAWDEPLGFMERDTFQRILQGIREIDPRPVVFFGGIGEPLAHPGIREMVITAHETGARVELITNATLLDGSTAAWMVASGLHRLWVSIDGATPESYEDVRLGDALPQVIENMVRLQEMRKASKSSSLKLGIAFVAMKRNIADLPKVIRLGHQLGADRFSISNVLPHTPELREQILFARSMDESGLQQTPWFPQAVLPRIDLDEMTFRHLSSVLRGCTVEQAPQPFFSRGFSSCPFVEKGSISIRWDGAASPCIPLMHTHTSYLGENQRTSRAYAVGNVRERPLLALWNQPEYASFRERLQEFDFSPCVFCNSCEMAEGNTEDCFGNAFPSCGGCLWAQGYIQCP